MIARKALWAGAAAAVAALALTGCGEGVARHRIRDALMQKGLPQPQAQCMADHMVDKLSISQLRKLEVLKTQAHTPVEAVMALQKIDDPEVVQVTITAAGLCLGGFAH